MADRFNNKEAHKFIDQHGKLLDDIILLNLKVNP